jgi:hypothetical protein
MPQQPAGPNLSLEEMLNNTHYDEYTIAQNTAQTQQQQRTFDNRSMLYKRLHQDE